MSELSRPPPRPETEPEPVRDPESDAAQGHLEDTVDALQRRALGDTSHRGSVGDEREVNQGEVNEDSPPPSAFEIDLDPVDQGTAGAAAADPE